MGQIARPGRYFTWAELVASATARRKGIPNQPGPTEQLALLALTRAVLDPFREELGRAVYVRSGYRSLELNGALGGSRGSQHVRGEAADITVPTLDAVQTCRALVAYQLPFDQLIAYAPERGGHVHVSYTTRRGNRRQILWAPASGGFVPWRRWGE